MKQLIYAAFILAAATAARAEQAQSLGRCGAGAELPRAIVIPARKGACRAWVAGR
jgi:hypothetical protein